MINETVIAAISTAFGVVATKGIDAIRSYRAARLEENKGNSEVAMAETDKAVSIYREIVESLQGDVEELRTLLKEYEHERITCREELAEKKAELKILRAKEKSG